MFRFVLSEMAGRTSVCVYAGCVVLLLEQISMAGKGGYRKLTDEAAAAPPATALPAASQAKPPTEVKPLPVGVSLRIRRTFDLNTVQQTFGCTLSLLTWWYTNEAAAHPKDMPQDMPPEVAGALSDWKPKWRPQIAIKNVMRVARPAECTYSIVKNPKYKEGNAVHCRERSPPSHRCGRLCGSFHA
jgi:hypothetical protein